MFEVGKTYTVANGHQYICIAVNETHAWLSGGVNETAYVWRQNGKAMLGPQWDIKLTPREYWITPVSMLVYGYPIPDGIHVHEVLPE